MSLFKYLKEMECLKFYILAVFLPVTLFYSVYFFLDPETILTITDEDHLFEWATVLFFLGATWYSFRLYRHFKNVFFLVFMVAFFFAAGEEISWGQRILGFSTPEAFMEKNVQKEFTIHNLELFNQMDLQGQPKSGLLRFLEINFLFRVATLFYGIIVPVLVFHSRIAREFARWLGIPVPPVSIGFFFLVNWMTYRTIHTSLPSYAGGGSEIFECLGGCILFIICLLFYKERSRFDFIGSDIKESFETEPSGEMVTEFKRQ